MDVSKALKLKDLQNYTLEPVSYYMKTFDDMFEGMGMHQHQYFEIMYSHSGSFTLEIFKENESPKLKTFSIRPGQIIILDGFTFHRIIISPHTSAVIYNIEFNPREFDEYNPFNVNSVLKVDFAALFTETNFRRISLSNDGYAVVNDTHQVDSTFKELVLMLTDGISSLEQACAVTIAELNLFTEISKCLETTAVPSLISVRQTILFKKIFDKKSRWIKSQILSESIKHIFNGNIKSTRDKQSSKASILYGYNERLIFCAILTCPFSKSLCKWDSPIKIN